MWHTSEELVQLTNTSIRKQFKKEQWRGKNGKEFHSKIKKNILKEWSQKQSRKQIGEIIINETIMHCTTTTTTTSQARTATTTKSVENLASARENPKWTMKMTKRTRRAAKRRTKKKENAKRDQVPSTTDAYKQREKNKHHRPRCVIYIQT